MKKAICQSCKQDIVWIKMGSGKMMPCNPQKIAIVTEDGDVVVGRVSHFSTCQFADRHRKGKK